MNIQKALDGYISSKRPNGSGFQSGAIILMSFRRHVGNITLRAIQVHDIQTFLDGPATGPLTWRNKYLTLLSFCEYWFARHEIDSLPMPESRAAPATAFVPYIYSRAEVKRLLSVSPKIENKMIVDAGTFRTLLLFLYGTGVLIGEALSLRRKDVDLAGRHVMLFSSKFPDGRKLPIGTDLCDLLRDHFRNSKLKKRSSDLIVFRNKNGGKISIGSLNHRFRNVREAAGIARLGSRREQPRMHDLRHTFAVHRITSWLKHGADMNQMIPALSVYLGQVELSSAERYLRLAPERFRTQLKLLSPRTSQRRWRDDHTLMTFLDSL